ncbi:immunoglobulin-like and fibronectin type III domain-containing protein 1 [Antennarius striatus]|uniref:immunoglobulin-like and fibronectin type III domain-containing protein 1 n=1 Tax=Antennarius striatus TaxID=241820 RepID=UPI0035AF6FAA
MWKRTRTPGPAPNRKSFSIVHQYIQHFNEVSGNKSAVIRRRTKSPGVTTTQYVTNVPEGKSIPEFRRKPAPITVKEGKCAAFKAVVIGDPRPDVSWRRSKGPVSKKDKFKSKYDEATGEHVLEIYNVSAAEEDTYRCCAVNQYGKALCSAALTVTDAQTHIADFRKLLRKSKVEESQTEEGDDRRFWDAMLDAERKDYQRVCAEFGVTDVDSILQKLEDKRRERAQQDDVSPSAGDGTEEHRLKESSVKAVKEDDLLKQAGEEEDVLFTEFKLSSLDFVIRIQEVRAHERDDALFECVLTHPLPRITWMGRGSVLEDGQKYNITVSHHKLIHRLRITECSPLDKGIYSAVAGIISCSARLMVEDPGVHFICGLSDVSTTVNDSAELSCKLSSDECEGAWFRDGMKISPDDNFAVMKDGAIHKLVINMCREEHSGKYRFEADGRKTEAMIIIRDPPRFDPEGLHAFCEPLTVKVGHSTAFKVHFVGHEPIKVQWYREGVELQDGTSTRVETGGGRSRLVLSRCQRRDSGEVRIRLKNDHGFTEAVSQLTVLDKPTPPLGPAEVTESSATRIEFRWRPPKDDGGSSVISYLLERQQVGRNTWKKLEETPGVDYRDTDVEHGRKYRYRVRALTAEGASEPMETDHMQAGTLAFPGPPAPPKVVSASDDCINVSWDAPPNRGGSRLLGYILEKRKKGSNLWTVVNDLHQLIKEKNYAVTDVVSGLEYEFRVTAINLSGVGEFSSPSEFVFARDPKTPPGGVTGLKVVESSYSHLVLTWTKPEDKPGVQDEAKGYFVELRQAESLEWSRCTSTPILTPSFSVRGLKPMDMYWIRVIATNDGGDGPPQELDSYVLAMPSPVRPKFTNKKMKSFLVVKAGNSVRITVNYEASPRPAITWMKDGVPVGRRVTVSNSDGSSQLLIPLSERPDSGVYSILVKNLAGQETFSTEVRVTDDPKPPGPVELQGNVPGTVTLTWGASPDEKRDDRLHYSVSALDSSKRTWTTVAERLFNHRFTLCNVMLGRQYSFRVYARNDMGVSAPSESPTWGTEKKREKFVVSRPTRGERDLRCAPSFMVPLKLHTAPKGYECYMSCAVRGNPPPRVTWYRDHVSLNTNTNYHISNTWGVCSLLILQVAPRDTGEYRVTAENALGRAECCTVLSVRE